MKKYLFVICIIAIGLQSCEKGGKMPPIDELIDLDGSLINDSSLTNPENFLLSAAILNPSPADLDKPVVIAVHGFGASTFEWKEFRDFAAQSGEFLTSIVLLGAHGRDYADFKLGSWEDWQQPIIEEYNALREKGYKNISFAGSSTGCPLILKAINDDMINPDVLKKIFFIDPIVVPSSKILSIVGVVGPVISYNSYVMESGENGYWYKYTPYQALKQLNKITKSMRRDLEDGIELPAGIQMTVFKSKKDGSADPVSAVLMKEGVSLSDGSEIEVKMVDSELHVFTRLAGRSGVTSSDILLQQQTFTDIKNGL